MGDYSPKPFENVFSAELEEIAKRQGKSSITEVDRKELAGLALSGGGIRSATTSLGVLQALKKLGLLDAFDYLSTVSGGGFTGSWWSAWVSREFDSSATSEEKFFPPNERTQPERDLKEDPFHETNKIISSEETEGRRRVIDPVHHLRLFSNYLTPIKGLLSIDTWRAVTVITRNLGLTWLVLIPVLFAAVLIAQSYFTLQVDSETEFLYPYSHMNEDKILNQKIGHEMQALEAIDKVVHHDSSRSIVVSRIIHVGKQDPSSNVISAGDPLLLVSRDLDSLEKDEAMDSILAKDVSSWKTYIQLKTEIDSMQREVSVWRAADSMTHVQQRASTEKNYDATVSQLYRSLDANVDTIHIRLMQLQAELVKHRWQSRDEWLFNDVHLAYLGNRLALTSYPMIALFGWIAMFVFLWVINGGSKPFGGNVLQGAYAFALGIVIFWGLLWSVPEFFSHRGHIEFRPIPFSIASIAWTVVALIFLNRVIWDEAHWFWKAHRRESSRENQQKLSKLLELRRSRIVQSHERLLLTSFGLLILLGFGGFGHEFINYLVLYHPLHSEETVQWVVRGTSIALALGVLIGSSLVAKKSGPTTDPLDRTSNVRTNKLSGILMKIAPPLLLLMLLCGVSWVSHWVLQEVVFRAEDSANRSLITIVFLTWLFGGVSVYYAIQEIQFRSHERLIRRCLIAYLVIPPIASIGSILSPHPFYTGVAWLSIILFVAVWAIVFWKYRGEQNSLHEEIRHDSSHSPKDHSTIEPPKWRLVSVASITTVMIVAVSVLLLTLGALFLQ